MCSIVRDQGMKFTGGCAPLRRQGQAKMSKSDPGSAIFMEDSEAEVGTKIKKAFCPPPPPTDGAADGAEKWNPRDNPCLEYVRMIILPRFGRFEVSRKDGAKCGTHFFA